MQATRLAIPDVMLIEPKVFGDTRGFFFESFNQRAFNDATGTNHQFVQDNHSRSTQGVLRGLHEAVNGTMIASFALIWMGVLLMIVNAIRASKKSHSTAICD